MCHNLEICLIDSNQRESLSLWAVWSSFEFRTASRLRADPL